jgi:hypothetical protein
LLDQPLGEPGHVAVRNHHALRQLAKRHPVRRLIELRHQVEARQRHVELVAQAAAYFSFDQGGAGEQPQPQPQLGLVVGRAFRTLVSASSGMGTWWSIRSLRPATVSVVPVIALRTGRAEEQHGFRHFLRRDEPAVRLVLEHVGERLLARAAGLGDDKAIAAPTRSVSV